MPFVKKFLGILRCSSSVVLQMVSDSTVRCEEARRIGKSGVHEVVSAYSNRDRTMSGYFPFEWDVVLVTETQHQVRWNIPVGTSNGSPLDSAFGGLVRPLRTPPNREEHTRTLSQTHKRPRHSVSMSPFYFSMMLVSKLVGRLVCVCHQSHLCSPTPK